MGRRRSLFESLVGPLFRVSSVRSTVHAALRGPGPLAARLARREAHRLVNRRVRWR